MKNITLPAVCASVSGGITGILVYFAVFGLNPEGLKPVALLGIIAGFSCLAVLMALACMAVFSAFFKNSTENEIRTNILIFLIPSLSVFALPIYLKFYEQLFILSPLVLGNIYLPFFGYEHINMAKFFLICSAGSLWLAVFFITAVRFTVKFYNNNSVISVKHTGKTVFWYAFIFFILTSSFVTFIYPPTGDEPHYLITARSMSVDFDLDLQNNYTDPAEYLRYFPSELDYKNLHTVAVKGKPGVYTSHDMGLPLLIMPFAAAGGRYGVQLFMNFVSALLCAAIYMMLCGLGIKSKIAAASAMTAAVCMPLTAGSSLVLTEIPAALIFAYSVYVLTDSSKRGSNLLFFTLLAFLPWLHLKFAIFPAVFYIFYYYSAFKNRNFNLKKELLNNIPVFLSAVLYLLFYYSVYGIIAPFGVKELHENIYAADASQQMNTFILDPVHFITSAFAVLFDRDYGLLPYCLLFILSLWGIMRASSVKKPALFIPLLLAVPYIAVFLLWKDWTGSMTPARQLIPVLPMFIFYAAYFLESSALLKTNFFKFLFAASVLISWLLAAVPPLRYGASKNKIYGIISAHAPAGILWVLPPFCDNTAAGMAVSVVYLTIIITGYYYYTRRVTA